MFAGRFFGARFYGRRFFGKVGLVVDGAYDGSRYFGARYFGARYFGSNSANVPFAVEATNTPALSGVLGVAGNLVFGADFALAQTGNLGLSATASLSGGALSFDNETWAFTPPLEISGITGTVGVTGNLVITTPAPGRGSYFGRRYYGSAYFGPRYYGSALPWPFTITQGIGMTGALNAAGSLGSLIAVNPTTMQLQGAVEVAGDFTFDGAAVQSRGGKGFREKAKRRRFGTVEADPYWPWVIDTLTKLAASGVLDE